MADLSIRLRDASPGLLALPWLRPLGEWTVEQATLRELPVGPSRHLVRFAEADGVLYALKELPTRVAAKEYRVLRTLEDRELPAVRPVGLVEQPAGGNSILVTEYLGHAWQYRRLFQRLSRTLARHRERLLDAMAGLLVDLHRAGVFWGDCSLANTLFKRDGQALQAFLVDAETSEMHPSLSRGQRELDLGILVENVTGDLLDLALAMGETGEHVDADLAAAESVATRYWQLWDELALEPVEHDRSRLRLKVAVADRRFHSEELRRLTGLEVGEGQATVLLNDLRGYQCRLEHERPGSAGDEVIGYRWLAECFRPGVTKAALVLDPASDPIQAYCDLLEVRWLLSERSGHDVGDEAALEALAEHRPPAESVAEMAVVEATTSNFAVVDQDG